MVLSQRECAVQMMLAAGVHLGTKNCESPMERYVFRRRADGIFIINVGKTWEKLQLAARVIVAIENPEDIIVQSARPYGQTPILKFAQYTGAQAFDGRHTPGTFTNQQQKMFSEPRLLIVVDPRTDHQPISEAAKGNIPTIAFCDTDAPLRYIDIAIPCNNKGKHSIGTMFWLLAGLVLSMRGAVTPTRPWDVVVDVFFYRDGDESKDREDDGGAPEYPPAEYVPAPALAAGDEYWGNPDAHMEAEGPTVPATVSPNRLRPAIPPGFPIPEWGDRAPTDWEAVPATDPTGWDG